VAHRPTFKSFKPTLAVDNPMPGIPGWPFRDEKASVVRKPVQELFLHPVSLLLVFHHAAPQGQGRCELGGDLWGAPGLKKVSDETGDKQDRTRPGTRKEGKPREAHTAPQTN